MLTAFDLAMKGGLRPGTDESDIEQLLSACRGFLSNQGAGFAIQVFEVYTRYLGKDQATYLLVGLNEAGYIASMIRTRMQNPKLASDFVGCLKFADYLDQYRLHH